VTRKLPTVGILGGGQLARMLSLAAAPLGVRTLVVDGSADACAGQVSELVVADWNDDAALEAFAARVDVVTFDFRIRARCRSPRTDWPRKPCSVPPA